MKLHHHLFIIAVAWHILTAFFSTGYHHPDEHHQIIEFAEAVTPEYDTSGLAWEYGARIRPATQPLLCYVIFQACEFASLTNPYEKTFALRLITGLLATLILFHFTNSCRPLISQRYWLPFLIVSYFLWFLPFINVRFSSETWSGLGLLMALSLTLRGEDKRYHSILIGFALGMAFLFRYQIALAATGLILWLILVKKSPLLQLVKILGAIVFIAGIGFLLDSYYYGDWTVTSWNYLNVNIFQSKASEFGVSPWFFYFYYVFRYAFFPIGIVILLSFFTVIAKDPKNIFVWTIVPFLAVHMIIPHKEVRFLFPLANLVPILVFSAIQYLTKIRTSGITSRVLVMSTTILLFINGVSLVISSLKPSGKGRMRITQKIGDIDPENSLTVYSKFPTNPYEPWGLKANFYQDQRLSFQEFDSSAASSVYPDWKTETRLLILPLKEVDKAGTEYFASKLYMKEVCRSVPKWMTPFLQIYGYRTKEILVLFSDSESTS